MSECARRLALAALFVLLAALPGCGADDEAPAARGGKADAPEAEPERAEVVFEEVTERLGVDFRHRAGGLERYPMPAIMGGGLAVFDADGDDALDLYFVSAGDTLRGASSDAAANRLYLRQPDGSYVDATASAGVGDRGYGMGTAVGDVDGDGDLDLFVSNWGKDRLYRNEGGGRFVDVTDAAGVGDEAWSSSASFIDFDGDGWLDLYVARYVDFDPGRECRLEGGRLDFCGPAQFPGVSDLLYRNRGDGTFEEVGRRAGLRTVADRGLGVMAADFDRDGDLDVYVANDSDPNNLWLNQGDGTFVDDAALLGVAYNRYGVGEAGMGLALGDPDEDGDLDLFVSHLIEETNTFYRNQGEIGWEDHTAEIGLGLPSVLWTGFGTTFLDVENDGDLDLAVVNGAVKARPRPSSEEAPAAGVAPVEGTSEEFVERYAEPDQFYLRTSNGFESVPAGDFTAGLAVSRALVAVDLDGDGDLDLVTTRIEGPAAVFENRSVERGIAGHWVALRVKDARGLDALGATVVVRAGARAWLRPVQPLTGYLSSGEARLHVGVGDATRIDAFEVTWPDGSSESFPGGEVDRLYELTRGERGA